MSLLVFDIGGTSIRAGAFADGRLTAIARTAAEDVRGAGDPVPALEAILARLAAQVLTGAAPEAVSLAAPGPMTGGLAHRLPSLLGPAYAGGLDFLALAQRLWPGVPAAACNDLTAAGHLYLARGEVDFGVLTLGSGVGCKLFVGGRPLLGPRGFGGEIGHWRVPGAALVACDCGGIGHLSALASGRGIARLAAFRGLAGKSPEAVVAAYHAGEPRAGAVLQESAQALGAALAAMGLAAGLETFILTGGFAMAAGEPYRRLAAEAAAAHAWDQGAPLDIRLAAPDEEPGLLGAGHYAQVMLQAPRG
jgi:glucokinase